MSLSLTTAIYLREVRSWRHRFWWLPLAGMLAVLLPVALTRPFDPRTATPSYSRDDFSSSEADSDTSFLMKSPVSPYALTLTVCAACAVTALLAAWLARELRGAEVRNVTLADLAITSIRPLELATAQIAAAWTIAAMLLVGAVPVFVSCGVRMGKSFGEVLTGLTVLFGSPLVGAFVGYAGFWWKRLVIVASRGRSFRLWMMGFAACAAVACWALATPLTYPLWRWVQKSLPPSERSRSYFDDVFLTNFVVGVWMLALLWLLAYVVCALWRRGWKGRLTLILIVAFGVVGGVKLKPHTSVRRLVLVQNLASYRYPVDWYLIRPDTSLQHVPTLPAVAAALAFGGDWDSVLFFDPTSQSHESRLRWEQASSAMILIGGAFYLPLTLCTFLFALGDLGWVLRQPWLVEVLRRPEAAPTMVELGGNGLRRRKGNYVFETRNPVHDYALARSGGSRAVLMAAFALILIGTAVSFFLNWNRFVERQPMSGMFVFILLQTWGYVAFLCWVCGMNCGLTIAHLKSSLQWWSLLSLPVKFRSVLWGVCMARLVDALLIMGAAFSLTIVPITLHVTAPKEYLSAEFIWSLYQRAALNMLTLTFVGLATSLFAASWSRGPAKATVIAVVLSALLTQALPRGYSWLVEWQEHRWNRFQLWGVEMPPPPLMREPWATIGTYVPYIVPALLSLFLLWWAVRRLRRET